MTVFIYREALLMILTINMMLPINAASAKEVSCESIVDTNWIFSVGKAKTCRIWTTKIDSRKVEISSEYDESMGGIHFGYNKNVSFLPVKVAEVFPNLLAFTAHCTVEEIGKKNFERLHKLKTLNLNGNQIKKIADNTFEDLVSLERLYLGLYL
jgi:Leucine rich repeat